MVISMILVKKSEVAVCKDLSNRDGFGNLSQWMKTLHHASAPPIFPQLFEAVAVFVPDSTPNSPSSNHEGLRGTRIRYS